MAKGRKAKAKAPSLAKTVSASLKGSRKVVATKKQSEAKELRSIERLLGEEFDSIAQARRALKAESKAITPKAAKAFKTRQERERVSFDVPGLEEGRKPPPKRKARPLKLTPPQIERRPAPPPEPIGGMPEPIAGQLFDGQPLADLPELAGKTMQGALAAIERDPAHFDAMLGPNQVIAAKIHGNPIEQKFTSFKQMAAKLRQYPRKGMTRAQTRDMWAGVTITSVGPGAISETDYRFQAEKQSKELARERKAKAQAAKTERIAERKAARERERELKQRERTALKEKRAAERRAEKQAERAEKARKALAAERRRAKRAATGGKKKK